MFRLQALWFTKWIALMMMAIGHPGLQATRMLILNGRQYRGKLLPFGELCIFHQASRHKGDLQWRRGIWVGVNERNGAHVLLTSEGAFESRSIRRLPASEQWSAEEVLAAKGLPWDFGGAAKRKRPLYTSARIPLLPDSATLEEVAKAAGRAAAETIAAGTPKPQPLDEAGSDPTTSSSSSSSGSSTDGGGIALAVEIKASGIAPAAEARASETAPTSTSVLYPPTFAGVNQVHGDVPLWELSDHYEWMEEVEGALENDVDEPNFEEFDDEAPPEASEEELLKIDLESDKVEVERLVAMGVLRRLRPQEDRNQYDFLTTKVVRDWRKRPTWISRSRLVAREFKTWTPWTQELFAPASSLGVIHGLMSYAQSRGLELVSLDVKDAYLTVKQKAPVSMRGCLERTRWERSHMSLSASYLGSGLRQVNGSSS